MDMSDQRTVIGLGEVLWDLLPDGRQLGGAPANFAYHARALGAAAALVSCVGDDPPGRAILDRLEKWGVDRRYVAADPVHPTGTVSVTLDAAGFPRYAIAENVAWDHLPPMDGLERLAARTDAVCFGTLCQRAPASRSTVRAFLRSVGPHCLRVCDVNLRSGGPPYAVVLESLRLADVLKLNEGELHMLAEMCGLAGRAEAVLSALADRFGLRMVALTRGACGSILYTPGGVSEHPGYAVDVVDTVGAGDAFAAAVVMGWLEGHDLDRINDDANRLASAVCAERGATPVLHRAG